MKPTSPSITPPLATTALLNWSIDADINYMNEQYLPETLLDITTNHKIIALHSTLGTGKTKALQNLKARHPTATFIIVLFRVSLVEAAVESYGVDNYQDMLRANDEEYAGSVAITFDSLRRLFPENYESKELILVLDEAQAGLRHLLQSKTFKDQHALSGDEAREKAISTLNGLVRTADKIILADADLQEDSVQYLVDIDSKDTSKPLIHYNSYQNANDAHKHETYEDIITSLLNDIDANKKVFIACDARTEVIALHNAIKLYASKTGKTIRVLDIHSERSQDEDVKQFMKSPSTVTLNYDIVITSPTAFSGIDINPKDAKGTSIKYFDNIYLITQNTYLSSDDLLQAVGRVRNPSGILNYFIKHKTSEASVETRPDLNSKIIPLDDLIALRTLRESLIDRQERQMQKLEEHVDEALKGRGYTFKTPVITANPNVEQFMDDVKQAADEYKSSKIKIQLKNYGLFAVLAQEGEESDEESLLEKYLETIKQEDLNDLADSLGKDVAERLTRSGTWAITQLEPAEALLLKKTAEAIPEIAEAGPVDRVWLSRQVYKLLPEGLLKGEPFIGKDLESLKEFLIKERTKFKNIGIDYSDKLGQPLKSIPIVLTKLYGLNFIDDRTAAKRTKKLDLTAFELTNRLSKLLLNKWISIWKREMYDL